MKKSGDRLNQERPSGPVVWQPPKRQTGVREILPAALLVLGPVVAWFLFAYFLG
jgi:hypothetical protein